MEKNKRPLLPSGEQLSILGIVGEEIDAIRSLCCSLSWVVLIDEGLADMVRLTVDSRQSRGYCMLMLLCLWFDARFVDIVVIADGVVGNGLGGQGGRTGLRIDSHCCWNRL